jgi:tRNA modification GTPase
VVDAYTELDENDATIIQMLQGRKAIVLLNKSDLPPVTTETLLREKLPDITVLPVSAKQETGIHELEQCIKEMFYQGELSFNDEVFITNIRQKNLLIEAKNSLEQVEQSIALQMPEDFFSIDLMDSYEALGKITGEQVGEDLVNEIFSKFCMGK